MYRQDSCNSCDQKRRCQEIYERLGKTTGPSVACKAVLAFLLPLVVFIASLVGFERILAEVISRKELRTGLAFLLAVSVTSVLLLVVRAVNRQRGKDK
jgi:hypothetical protein